MIIKNTYLKLIAILLALVCLLCSCKENADTEKETETNGPDNYELNFDEEE